MIYKIAYTYVTHGEVSVEASSLKEAKELSYEASWRPDREFMDDATFEIDDEKTNNLNLLKK